MDGRGVGGWVGTGGHGGPFLQGGGINHKGHKGRKGRGFTRRRGGREGEGGILTTEGTDHTEGRGERGKKYWTGLRD